MSETEPLVELLRALKARDYRFVTVTPTTHAIVLARPQQGPSTLRDIFGWNRWFEAGDLDGALLEYLESANMLDADGNKLRSRVRVASLEGELFLHSAFPTDAADAVFFGPDTYRFARFIRSRLSSVTAENRIIDMGAGSGAGGIVAAAQSGGAVELVDVNPAALRLAKCNAAAAGVQVELTRSDEVPSGADILIANPPYMMDEAARAYRDGGGLYGGAVALAWVGQALERVAPGGLVLLYTGAAFVDGQAPLMAAIHEACRRAGASVGFEEIDPDVFGDELSEPAYAEVERIAAIGAVIRLPA